MEPPLEGDVHRDVERAFADVGFTLDSYQVASFVVYCRLLAKWSARINLTAIRSPAQIVRRHFVDSVLFLDHANVQTGNLVADIGSGAGFPGLPIAVVRPDVDVVLFESVGKKAAFLVAAAHELGARNVTVETERIDPDAIADTWASRFDWVVSRYTAPVTWLARCAKMMLKSGGSLVAHKYDDVDEASAVDRAPIELGAESAVWKPDPRVVERRCFAIVRF